jgi:signal peptidase I
MKKEIIEWMKSIVFAVVFVFIIQLFVMPTTIYHTSMVPTLEPSDMVIVQKTKNVKYGDIIVFESEMSFGDEGIEELPFYRRVFVNADTKKKLIKRVIGVPGDKIEINGEKVYVNDILLDEKYIQGGSHDVVFYAEIPDDYYFVMGDNRPVSLDSRREKVGLISKSKIVGKATFRIYPFNKFGAINEF